MKEIIELFEELLHKGLVTQDKVDALKAFAKTVEPKPEATPPPAPAQ